MKKNQIVKAAEMVEEDSDIDNLDFDNFKGIYFGDKTVKYQDPVTGCHFEYFDLCKRMLTLKQNRKILDKRLGLSTSSTLLSPAKILTTKTNVKDPKAIPKISNLKPKVEARDDSERKRAIK